MARLITVAVFFFVFAGYSFMSATSWTAPTGAPPTNNVDEPINQGLQNQMKDGGFVTGGALGIASNRPTQKFINTDLGNPSNDWYQFTESNRVSGLPTMAFAFDRDGNGTYGNDYPVPFLLSTGANQNNDFAKFSNEVRANKYCDSAGDNCATPDDMVVNPSTLF